MERCRTVARVFIPAGVRSLTDGEEIIEADGKNVREVIDCLDRLYPGIKARLCHDDELAPGLSVIVGGSVSSMGLLQRVDADSEVHFLPAIGGG